MSSETTQTVKPKGRTEDRQSGRRRFTPRKRTETQDDKSCVLCAQDIDVYAIGFCDHPICMRCSAKMRILCKQNECSVCRKDLTKVIYSKTQETYSVLNTFNLKRHENQAVYFTNEDIKKKYNDLFLCVCLYCDTKHVERNMQELQKHMRKFHDLHFCDLCVKYNSNFVDETKAYSRKDLARHRRMGDEEDTSHKGHPNCEFCDVRYYDNDTLLKHLRQDHFFCHICDRHGSNQYYDKYLDLREHFREEHFLCEEGACAKEEYTGVFSTELDLIAHRSKVHQQKADRNIDLGFQYSRPTGAHAGRGRGRNRESQNQSSVNNRNEDDDLAIAIQESLRTSQTDGKKYRVERPKKRGEAPFVTQQEDVKLTAEDFPTLNDDKKTDTVPLRVASSNNAPTAESASAATVVAFAAGKSTGQSRYNQDDFPSLGGSSGQASATAPIWGGGGSSKPTKKANKGPVSVNLPIAHSSRVVNIKNNDDFPTLGGTKGSGNTFWGNVAQVPKKKMPTKVTITPKHEVQNNHETQKKSAKPTPSIVSDNTIYNHAPQTQVRIGSSKHSVHFATHDYSAQIEGLERPPEEPGISLGSNVKTISADGFSLLRDNQTRQNNSNQNYSIQDTDFPALGGSSRPKSSLFASSLPSRAKSSQGPSLNSLSRDINSQTKAKKKNDCSKKEKKSVKNNDPVEWWDQNKNHDSASINNDSYDPYPRSAAVDPYTPTPYSTENRVADVEAKKNNFSYEGNDFPSLGQTKKINASSQPVKTKSKKKKKKGIQTAEEINKHFPKSFLNIDAEPDHKLEIPSGTNLSLSSIFKPTVSNENHSTTEVKKPPPGLPKKPTSGNAAEKNMWLIETVQRLCIDEDAFNYFKSCSGNFRTGDISANEYYNCCVDLLGYQNFMAISTELVDLLPEEEKKKDLRSEIQTHMAS